MSDIQFHCKYDELIDPKSLTEHPKNRNVHSESQIERLAAIYKYNGVRHPIIVSRQSGFIVAGHGRKRAAIKAKMKAFPVVYQDFIDTDQEYAFLISDNALSDWSELDFSSINSDIGDLDPSFNIDMLGIDGFTIDVAEKDDQKKEIETKLSERFMIPPFSVLNAREGWWQERKKLWISLGIKSEKGRDAKVFGSDSATDDVSKIIKQSGQLSIFDPVLCEIAYRWFCPKNGTVLDPFAGGSVRGIVAAKIGLNYLGGDLRKEQVEENKNQAAELLSGNDGAAVWKCADSVKIDETFENTPVDFVFSCPPYADLEVYSDDKNDLSNMNYDDFKKAYFEIIKKSCSMLQNNRFACFVVGEVRDKKGNYYNFVSDTIAAFLNAGLKFYNEAILVTSVGTLPIRAGQSFKATRKLGKTHQNVLIFIKGDAKKATQECGDVFVVSNEELLEE